MSKYILTIEGDFKKGECGKCPIYGTTQDCGLMCFQEPTQCPLEEVKQGEWIKLTEAELDGAKMGYKCSVCGATITGYNIDNLEAVDHCFSCGVEMKGGK